MAFTINVSRQSAGDRSGDVYELLDTDGRARAEVWTHTGFNCLKWQVRNGDGSWGDILFHMPDWNTNPVPTRSGNPILFPFPGRMRGGNFTFEGKTYQLPLTESSGLHAIHGFTPRNHWRVADSNGDADFAFVTGEFSLARDLPEGLPCWPADFIFQVTYRLYRDTLRVEARVENIGKGKLPFGLGYHGYFRLPEVMDPDVSNYLLQANVAQVWETENSLPTGVRKELPPELDFRTPRPIGATALDHVLTGVDGWVMPGGRLVELARLEHPAAFGRVRILADSSFRELVLFTPQHRRAVAIEPYTCSADAANLATRGIDSGWRVLETGGSWEGVVEYRWEPTGA